MISAVLVLYNPNKYEKERVKFLTNYISNIFVIDNSPKENQEFPINYKNITYLPQDKNIGIAAALNIGVLKSKEIGCKYSLILDQDSCFNQSNLKLHLINSIEFFEKYKKIAVIATNAEYMCKTKEELVEVKSAINSGSIISIDKWNKVGGYNEELFLDHVDHEFSYKLKKQNFQIFLNTKIFMEHSVGIQKKFNFLGKSFISSGHSSLRQYYYIRNALYLRKEFPDLSKDFNIFLREMIIRIISFFYEKNTLKKCVSFSLGVLHYFTSRYGSLEGHKLFKYLNK